jgi:hypothetical protein
MLVRDSTGRWSDPVVLLIYSPLWAPFAWISWRLSTKPDSFIVRRVTILAANWALLCLALSSIFVFAVLEGGGNGAHYAAIPSVIACLQLLLLFSLAKAYFSLPRNRGDFYLLIPRLGGALLVGAIVLVVSSLALTPKRAFDEASSVGSLRTIYIAQKQFASDHVQLGFAPSLAQLGPTPGAELIDFLLASGTKSGYTFTITSASIDSQGRVTKYNATARPIHYDKRTTHSFLLDESGAIHYTTENRAPTTQDPALQ